MTCQHVMHLKHRIARIPGTSTMRSTFVETCELCGAAGESYAMPPPKRRMARREPGHELVATTGSAKPEPKPDARQLIWSRPRLQHASSAWWSMSPQARRADWLIIDGGGEA